MGRWRYALYALILVTSLSCYGLTRTYAKYVSADTENAAGRVASFDVSAGDIFTTTYEIALKPGGDAQVKTLSVKNSGEVAVDALCTMEIMGNLPLHILVTGKEGEAVYEIENTLDPSLPEDPITASFSITLEAGEEIGSFCISFSWADGDGYEMEHFENGVEAVRLTLEAKQID